MANLLLAGDGVDCELRIPGYAFKVHRNVLSESSNLAMAPGYMVLAETEDPLIVLRLIQAIYTNEYFEEEADLTEEWRGYLTRSKIVQSPTFSEATTAWSDPGYAEQLMGNATDSDDVVSWAGFTWEYNPKLFFLHIDMYHLAETYAMPDLSSVSFRKFVRDTANDEFSVDRLLWTIKYLYITTAREARRSVSPKMRMRAVYLAQKSEMRLHSEPKFEALMKGNSEFMWDYTSKCHKARYLQCWDVQCEATFAPREAKDCDCGGEGVCDVCVAAEREGRRMKRPMCAKCGRERLQKWDLEYVDLVDITSVKAFGEMFHPAQK